MRRLRFILLLLLTLLALLPWWEPEARTARLALHSLWLALGSAAVATLPGTLLAVLLARTDLPGRRALCVALACLLFVPLHLHVAGWQAGFALEGWYTLATGRAAWLQGWPAAIWVHGMAGLPWVVLIVAAGLRLVEPELEEQALLDAAPRAVLLHVTLRRALPAVALAALWVALVAASEITVTDLFQVRTYAEVLYTEMAIGQTPGQAPLAVLPGMLLVAALVVVALAACSYFLPVAQRMTLRSAYRFRLDAYRWPAAIAAWLVLAAAALTPLASLVWKAGVVVEQFDAQRVRSWSAVKCLRIVLSSPWQYREEVFWSAAIGASAATFAVLLAVALVWLSRGSGWRQVPAMLAAAVCLAMPGPVVGLMIIWLLNRPEWPPLVWMYDRTIVPPLLAQSVRCLPLAIFVLWQPLRSVPCELLETARLDGAGLAARWGRVIIPQRRAALAVAWLVALSAALAELGGSLLVAPPGITTLTIRIFNLLHYGVEDYVAGICLAMCLAAAMLAWVVVRLSARWLADDAPGV